MSGPVFAFTVDTGAAIGTGMGCAITVTGWGTSTTPCAMTVGISAVGRGLIGAARFALEIVGMAIPVSLFPAF